MQLVFEYVECKANSEDFDVTRIDPAVAKRMNVKIEYPSGGSVSPILDKAIKVSEQHVSAFSD